MTSLNAPCSDGFQIALRADRQLLPADTSCRRHLLVSLSAPPSPSGVHRSPLNISIVLDCSGSMSGMKLAYITRAARCAVGMLNERDRASIVAYNEEVRVLAPSALVTPHHYDRLQRAITALEASGMTNLGGGWLTGCDQVADYLDDEAVNRALLLTDGLANVGITDEEVLANHARELNRRGISTTTFGVGEGFAESLLIAMSNAGGGHFYYIAQASQIPGYFQQELGEMLHTVARDLNLVVTAPEGAALTLINDLPHERQGAHVHIPLGDAQGGERRQYLFRLDLPGTPLDASVDVAARLYYQDPATGTRRVISAPLAFASTYAQQADAQAVDQEVIDAAARLSAEVAKAQAIHMERQGLVQPAAAKLREASDAVREMGASDAVHAAIARETKELVKEMLDRTLSESHRKEVAYAAYLSINSRSDHQR